MYEQPDYLVHYGTPGMRWGHRKAILSNVSSGSDSAKRLTSSVEKLAKKKKDLSKMSDDEIKKQVPENIVNKEKIFQTSLAKRRKVKCMRIIII